MLSEKDQKRAEYLLYEEKVRKLSEKTFREEFFEFRDYRGDVFELDHMLSIKDGFDQNVPIEVMSDLANLQLIPAKANRKKGDKSSLSFSELLERIVDREETFS
jgi:hypothetical protein